MNMLKMMIAGVFLLTFSSFAVASGSHNSNSGKMADSEYSKGKMIVHKQLICGSCPLKSAQLDRNMAQDIVMKLKNGDSSLGSLRQSDAKSVVVYLQDRFSL